VRTPQDLRGGRVGTAGIPYQSAYLTTILAHAGVPRSSVKETNVGFDLVLAARKATLANRGDDVRAFVQALARGYAAARADPQAATDALVRAAPDLDKRFALASVKASLLAFFSANASEPWGWQDPAAWQAYERWMFSNNLIGVMPSAGATPYTNEFLAGQGS